MLGALWNKIKQGLAKTRAVFGRLASLFRLRGKVDKEFLAKLEETLYLADVGPTATGQIVERVRQAFLDREVSEDVLAFVKKELVQLLNHTDRSLHFNPAGPTVILVAGVNGSGKTTSIAKLAYWLKQQGKKVLLAAADTFRAAAVEQLTVWSQRIGCDIVKGEHGSDPAAVAHNACEAAVARGIEVVIVDTAGRLQTQDHLMRQLEKIRREILQNFSHELRTPIGNVMMSLDIAVADKFKSPQEQQEFLRIAHSSAERLEALLADIILLADMDNRRVNLTRQPIDRENHILIPIRRRLARYEEKRLIFIPRFETEGVIKAPRREFTQALLHLLDNAFKFSPQGGAVRMTVRPGENGGASIIVHDEGVGIPPELREKVFERFYQTSQGDSRAFQGLGVGLTIARAVFSSLGGDVRILDSEKGCRVQATLPELRAEDISYE